MKGGLRRYYRAHAGFIHAVLILVAIALFTLIAFFCGRSGEEVSAASPSPSPSAEPTVPPLRFTLVQNCFTQNGLSLEAEDGYYVIRVTESGESLGRCTPKISDGRVQLLSLSLPALRYEQTDAPTELERELQQRVSAQRELFMSILSALRSAALTPTDSSDSHGLEHYQILLNAVLDDGKSESWVYGSYRCSLERKDDLDGGATLLIDLSYIASN